jgi:hypothetical protein
MASNSPIWKRVQSVCHDTLPWLISFSLDGSAVMDTPQNPLVLEATHGGRRFRIEQDETVGFYVYAFDGERCTHDHLQNTLEIAKQCAREEFGVPEDAWHEATSAA